MAKVLILDISVTKAFRAELLSPYRINAIDFMVFPPVNIYVIFQTSFSISDNNSQHFYPRHYLKTSNTANYPFLYAL